MGESEAKTAFCIFLEQALASIRESGGRLQDYRMKETFFDSARDEKFTKLPSFANAADALSSIPQVRNQWRQDIYRRIPLQFLYTLAKILREPSLDDRAFERLWTALWKEISKNEETWYIISNLQNFQCKSRLMDLGDGITVQDWGSGQVHSILMRGGHSLEELDHDRSEGGSGGHVLVIQATTSRSPTESPLEDSSARKVARMMLALRLLKNGDVRMGRMFFTHLVDFNVGYSGRSLAGFTVWNPGKQYSLDDSDVPAVQALYRRISAFENKYISEWRNLAVALRSFSSIFDRLLHQSEDRVIDAVTALEALLPVDTELSFRLAFRAAGILADDDEERSALFKEVRDYYDTRSRIVHGSTLERRHRELIQNDEPLRNIVRRLLNAFLHLLDSSEAPAAKQFYRELDTTLQHSQRRADLRRKMSLLSVS